MNEVIYEHAKQVIEAMAHVTKFDTYVDIGANVGKTSLPLCEHFKKVIAVEPNPLALERFKSNVIPDNLMIIEKGMYSREGTMTLAMPNNNSEHSSLEPMRLAKWKDEELVEWEVEVVTLDSLGLQALDLLKIDTEQGENAIFEGGMQTIEKYKPVIFFENKRNEAQRSVKMLQQLHYKIVPMGGNILAYMET